MSEEVAQAIGDVLAENERLKQQLAQAMELLSATPETMAGQTLPEAVATVLRAMRAAQQLHLQALDKLKQAEAELAQVKDTATMAAVAYGMNEALNDAEANNKALRIAIRRLTEANDGLMAVNRQINIFALQQVERAMLLERAARRLVVAWRAERKALRAVNEAWLRDGKAIEGLRAALQGLLDEPYGCALCDAGRLLSPAKMHMDECPYEIARALLNELEAGMYSGDEYYGDDVTSPLERPLFSGYKGGPLMNPLARIQKDTNMTPQEALDYINGARFANYSGQIVERRDGRDRYIVCEIGCNCSEIPGKISDEYGEALVTLLNSVEVLLAQQGTFTRMIAEVCDHNETLHNALRLIAKNEPSTLDVRGIARDALNAIKPIDADE